MKKYLLAIAFITLGFFNSKGQKISGVINFYTHVSAIGANNVTVASSIGFKVGEKVLIIEMQGSSIDTTNSTNFGNIISYGNAGNYEFDTISTIAGDVISFKNNLSTIFDTAGMVQLINVPVYSNAIITGTLTCQAWDGTTGGVLVFQSSCSITLNANIDVSMLGFRGGSYVDGLFGCGNYNYYLDFNTNKGGEKGESISEYIPLKNGGMGKQANGGGGGNPGNSGGGGGSNYGSGGMGGDEFNACNTIGIQGYPGVALSNGSKIFMGGGGGGGFADNGEPTTSGGNGGAIAFIITNSFNGNSFSIVDTGQSIVRNAADESAGGGGAGGTVILSAQKYSSLVTINTNGGYGGSTYNGIFASYCHGTGGGAGGGLLWINGSTLSSYITYTSNGGAAGLVLNPASSCYNTTFGATSGDSGGVIFNLPINERTYKKVDLGNDTTLCLGQSTQLNAGSEYKSYLWQNNSTDSVLVVSNTGKYYVTATDSNGCVSRDTVNVKAGSLRPLDIEPQNYVLCFGSSVILRVNNSVANFVWSPSTGLNTTTGDSVIANPTINVTYTVTGTDSIGCSASDTDVISVVPAPNKPTITISGDTLISSATQGNQWYFNDTILNGETTQKLIISGQKKGSYTVSVINPANGCSSTSDSTSGINQLSLINEWLSVYPNPTSGAIFITISSSVKNVKDWNLKVSDVLGRTLFTRLSLGYDNEIELPSADGVYFITIVAKTERAVFSVVKSN